MVPQTCELEIKAIVLHRRTHEPSAILQDRTGLRVVTVPVDLAEAGALVIGIEQSESGLPFPEDLVVRLFDKHRFTAEGVYLRPLKHDRFETSLHYRAGRRHHEIRLRPGEGLSLSVRFEVPIYIRMDDLNRCSSCGIPSSLDLFSQDVLLLDSASIRGL
jgi:bifunctional DNase/RNase